MAVTECGVWLYKPQDGLAETLSFVQNAAGDAEVRFDLEGTAVVGAWSTAGRTRLAYVQNSTSIEATSPGCPVLKIMEVRSFPQDLTARFAISADGSLLRAASSETTVIISSGSGAGQASDFYDLALKPLLDALQISDKVRRMETQSTESITVFAKGHLLERANQAIEQTVILLSGDGGTVDIVNALYSGRRSSSFRSPTIVALPLGTGNALSNSYRYNSDNTWGLATLARGRARPLPVLRVSFSPGARLIVNEGRDEQPLPYTDDHHHLYGAVVCSWGLHATLVADSDTAHYRQFGAQRFQMVAKELLFPSNGESHHEYAGKLSLQDNYSKEWESSDIEKHAYVLATLVSNLEKTFVISPDSKTLDGIMRLVKIPAMDGSRLMKVMEAAYQDGKHITMDDVGYREIAGLRIDFDEDDGRWRRVCVDGKIVKVEQGGYMIVQKAENDLLGLACLS